MQSSPIYLTGSNHDFILDEIKIRDTIEYLRKQLLMRGMNK